MWKCEQCGLERDYASRQLAEAQSEVERLKAEQGYDRHAALEAAFKNTQRQLAETKDALTEAWSVADEQRRGAEAAERKALDLARQLAEVTIEDVEDEREPKCECKEIYDCGRTADEHEIERLKKSLSDSQAKEAMKDEAIRALLDALLIHSCAGKHGSDGEPNWADLRAMGLAALSQSPDSWLKREKAKVWQEAAMMLDSDFNDWIGDWNQRVRNCRAAMLTRAAALEAEAKGG